MPEKTPIQQAALPARPRSKSGYGQVKKPINYDKGQIVAVDDIQKILDLNSSKRQNVPYLKNLLDSQLNALCKNLKVMQNDNSDIETETISRLQLIEKFGDDANQGLHVAK